MLKYNPDFKTNTPDCSLHMQDSFVSSINILACALNPPVTNFPKALQGYSNVDIYSLKKRHTYTIFQRQCCDLQVRTSERFGAYTASAGQT